jgi:Bcr/CflA subfamily drug resistance transporter
MKISKSPSLWLLFLLAGFPQLSETIYSPALPAIASSLQTNNHWVQWTLSIYFIGFAMGVFFWGRLSDHTGRRAAMLSGLILYVLASFLCLVAKNIEWLLFARLLQGLGASAGSVVTQTIAREALTDHVRHRFFAAAGFAIAFSIALGPFIGGYLTQWFNWRSNFLLLVLLGAVLIVSCALKLPETRNAPIAQREKILAVAVKLLHDKHVLICIWLVGVVNGFMFSYFAEAPFIFIHVLKVTPSIYGWLSIGIALAALLGSITSRRLVGKLSTQQLIRIGCACMAVGSGILTLIVSAGWIVSQHQLLSLVLLMLPLMLVIYGGFGFVIPMTLSTALQKHQASIGTAGALFGLSYYVLVAVFTWIMGLIHNGTVFPMPIYFLVLSLSALLATLKMR